MLNEYEKATGRARSAAMRRWSPSADPAVQVAAAPPSTPCRSGWWLSALASAGPGFGRTATFWPPVGSALAPAYRGAMVPEQP